jgi:hypothetical protein
MPEPPLILLALCDAAPTLPAVDPAILAAGPQAKAQAIGYRCHTPGRTCALCGEDARRAVIAGPSPLITPARWLDTCRRCFARVVQDLPGLDDADVLDVWRRREADRASA